jgi:DNA-binding PadR family transcriptional regulator
MERHKWIAAEWKVTEQNQRARFYRITAEGRRQLANDRSRWDTMVAAIASILEA